MAGRRAYEDSADIEKPLTTINGIPGGTAIVTGGTSGIGRTTAERIAEWAASVAAPTKHLMGDVFDSEVPYFVSGTASRIEFFFDHGG